MNTVQRTVQHPSFFHLRELAPTLYRLLVKRLQSFKFNREPPLLNEESSLRTLLLLLSVSLLLTFMCSCCRLLSLFFFVHKRAQKKIFKISKKIIFAHFPQPPQKQLKTAKIRKTIKMNIKYYYSKLF